MHIRHLEKISSIDKVVVLPVLLADIITILFIQVHFYENHTFPCQSLLVSITVPNDYIYSYTKIPLVQKKQG